MACSGLPSVEINLKDITGDCVHLLPVRCKLEIDGPVGVGRVSPSVLQTLPHGFRLRLAEPDAGWHSRLYGSLKKRQAFLFLAESDVNDDSPTFQQQPLDPVQALGMGAIVPH
jgi:hypothetical protein